MEVGFPAIGVGIHVLPVFSFPTQNFHHPPTLPTLSLQPMNSLPIGPGTPPPLTSPILSFLAGDCGELLNKSW